MASTAIISQTENPHICIQRDTTEPTLFSPARISAMRSYPLQRMHNAPSSQRRSHLFRALSSRHGRCHSTKPGLTGADRCGSRRITSMVGTSRVQRHKRQSLIRKSLADAAMRLVTVARACLPGGFAQNRSGTKGANFPNTRDNPIELSTSISVSQHSLNCDEGRTLLPINLVTVCSLGLELRANTKVEHAPLPTFFI